MPSWWKEHQEFLLRREKETTADYTRKMQEGEKEKKKFDAMKTVGEEKKQEFGKGGLEVAGGG